MSFSAHTALIRQNIGSSIIPARTSQTQLTNQPKNATVKFGWKNPHLTGYFSHPETKMNESKGKQQNA